MKNTRTQKSKTDKLLDSSISNGNDLTSKKKRNTKLKDKNDDENNKMDIITTNNSNTDKDKDLNYLKEIESNLKDFKLTPRFFKKEMPSSNHILPKLAKVFNFTLISPLEIYYKIKHDEFKKLAIDEDKCSICQCTFYDDELINLSIEDIKDFQNKKGFNVLLLENCQDHFFHDECLISMMSSNEWIKCPNCNKIYGIMSGNQPTGIFAVRIIKEKCSGFRENTIQLYYEFPDGPGYSGTTRNAYLPNNKEGKEVLALFKVAFDRKLMYTIGRSVTTGKDNCVVWNGVHHKTNLDGGPAYFGYPDNTYFNRVKEELAAKGVVPVNIKEDLIKIADDFITQSKQISKRGRKQK